MPFISSIRGTFGPNGKRTPRTTEMLQAIHYGGKTGSQLSTGGTITEAGGYRIHAFETTGNSTLTINYDTEDAEYLIVAGGGGGGSGNLEFCAGAGAGGYRSGTISSLSSGSRTVTVGSAGNAANNGGGSSFNGVSTTGGGRGGNTRGQAGAPGGSGGGGGDFGGGGGSGSSGQGYNGSSGRANSPSSNTDGGSGGGAGGNSPGYPNGPGVNNSISGSSVEYARGGRVDAGAGTHYRGFGGGKNQRGGHGVVIVRYPTV